MKDKEKRQNPSQTPQRGPRREDDDRSTGGMPERGGQDVGRGDKDKDKDKDRERREFPGGSSGNVGGQGGRQQGGQGGPSRPGGKGQEGRPNRPQEQHEIPSEFDDEPYSDRQGS